MATPRNRTLDVHLNLNVRGMHPSATVALNERCNALRRAGREIFKLGLGQSPFPVPNALQEELRANAHQKDYLAVRGLWELREAVADYHRRSQRLTCAAEDILVGPGSKELMFLLQLVYYGDLVLPTPAWVSYVPQANIIGRRVHLLPTSAENRWRMTPDQLADLCRSDPHKPRIVILNYPSNPTGGTYRLEELKEIARIARKHKVVLLSDEIYGELHHMGQHVSIARFYPEGTIVSGGISKWCGAGGWRLGTFAFPRSLRWLLDAMAIVASETYTSTCAPIQYAAVRAFQGGLPFERYLWNSRRILRTLGKRCAQELDAEEVRVRPPRGAFYLFPDFTPHAEELRRRGITTDRRLCEQLLEDTGVAILPGSDFGRAEEELTARIAYVDFDGARALAAVERLPRENGLPDDFLDEICDGVITAIRRIRDWLRSGS